MAENTENNGAPPAPRSGERIAKLLARAGIASRREVERMIADGRVKLNGTVLTTPATVLENLRGVMVDEKPVAAPEKTRLFAFHKPPGLITAERDPAGRPTIYNALINALPAGTPRMMPVGRLDFSTEGLLLLTNDGEFKRQLELPSTGVPRTYRARVFGTITQTQLEELAEGVTVDGMHYGRIIADMERRTGRNGWVEMTLTEGKNREVRRVLEHLGLEVSRLIRTAYGPFHLGQLGRGGAVEVRPADLERFRGSLKSASYTEMNRVEFKEAARPAPARPAPAAPAAAPEKPRSARPYAADGAADRRAPGKPAPSRSGGHPSASRSGGKPSASRTGGQPSASRTGGKRAAPARDEMDGEWISGGRRNAPGPRRGDRSERSDQGERKSPRSATAAKPARGAPRKDANSSSRSGQKPGPKTGPRSGPKPGPRGKR